MNCLNLNFYQKLQLFLTKLGRIALIMLSFAAASFSLVETPLAKTWPLTIKARNFPLSKQCPACENFYNYVCAETIKKYHLPKDRSSHSFSFNEIGEQIFEAKKSFLVNLAHHKITDATDPLTQSIQEEVRNYFLSMYDKKAIYQQSLEEVRSRLANAQRLYSRNEALDYLAKHQLDHQRAFLVAGEVVSNLENPTEPELMISTQHLLSLPLEMYKNKDIIADFRQLLTQFFTVLNDPNPKDMANKVANFELELAKISPNLELQRKWSTTRTILDRKTVTRQLNNLKLDYLFNAIPETTAVIIDADPKLKVINWINDAVGQMELRQLQAIILYCELFNAVSEISKPFKKARRAFNAKYFGAPPKEASRLERAAISTIKALGRELDYLMLSYVFLDFPKERVTSLVERVRQALLDQLAANDWLSAEGKAAAINKVQKIGFSVAYPDDFKDWRIFKPLILNPKQPLTNHYAIKQRIFQEDLKLLASGRIEKTWWHMSPLAVNAYYDPTFNRMVVPLGILQPPFFDPKLSDTINLGGIGAVIGHEMGHAIDDIGSQFDAEGCLKEWMPKIDRERFKERTKKLIKQFDAIGHRGYFTLGENIGDLVGLNVAYRALPIKKPLSVNNKTSKDERMQFFMQFAKLWCTCERPSFTKMRLLTDPHALSWARTNQNVKQIPEFSKLFNCKPGDQMHLAPHEQVKIW